MLVSKQSDDGGECLENSHMAAAQHQCHLALLAGHLVLRQEHGDTMPTVCT